ncbi:hypothetical protein PMZ80_006888 [Knufia obscura]|uniref:Uncharacterized protein n=1 Tax=Knufia obscura TaxID=1635080 RepID=A0ABR0RJN4_9EURO|nr:hypothetical protein PMZ80_006888 [Knufia obscura]
MLFNNILVVLAVAAGITKAAPIKQRDEVDSAFVPISGWHGDSIGNVESDKVKKDEMEANTMDFNPKNVAFVPISGWHGD